MDPGLSGISAHQEPATGNAPFSSQTMQLGPFLQYNQDGNRYEDERCEDGQEGNTSSFPDTASNRIIPSLLHTPVLCTGISLPQAGMEQNIEVFESDAGW